MLEANNPGTMSIEQERKRMRRLRGARKGWFIKERGGRFQAHAWDRKADKYQAKTFDSREAAQDWAEKTHAAFVTDQLRAGKQTARGITLRSAGDEFLADLQYRGAAADHQSLMARILKEAEEAGCGDLPLNEPEIVSKTRAFLAGLKKRNEEPASAATRNSYLTALRAVGNFALRQYGDIRDEVRRVIRNPFQKLDKIPVASPMKDTFTLAEVRELVSAKHKAHPFYRPFCSMIYTGFRMNEMANLQGEWFLWDAQRLRLVISKKRRAQPGAVGEFRTKNLHERVTRLHLEYIGLMRPKSGKLSGPLFPDLLKMDRKGRQRLFDRYVTDCGITVGDRTPHSCRHTWTCLMLASGENEILVKQYAGHSEKEMTEHYAKQQDLYRVEVEREGWPRGELCLRSAPGKPKLAIVQRPNEETDASEATGTD